MKAMSIWGIGPAMVAPTIGAAVAAGAATYLWPGLFSFWFIPYPLLATLGTAMIVASVPVFVLSAWMIAKAYARGHLATNGPYALCRNPLYANYIILLFPGIALLSNSWLMLAPPAALYIAVRMRIHLEEKYLQEQFGEEFIEYRKRTNALFPKIWR